MKGENLHIPLPDLWSYTTGTATLSDEQFAHFLLCSECQSLVNQFIEVLDGLPPLNPSLAA